MSDHALQWYLVYTKVQKERVAYEQLCNQSYHAFLPLLPVKKRVRGVSTGVHAVSRGVPSVSRRCPAG